MVILLQIYKNLPPTSKLKIIFSKIKNNDLVLYFFIRQNIFLRQKDFMKIYKAAAV